MRAQNFFNHAIVGGVTSPKRADGSRRESSGSIARHDQVLVLTLPGFYFAIQSTSSHGPRCRVLRGGSDERHVLLAVAGDPLLRDGLHNVFDLKTAARHDIGDRRFGVDVDDA